jgi:hypothetical protein
MDTVSIVNKSTLERLKLFSGLIVISIIVLIFSFISIYEYNENTRMKIAIEEQNIASIKAIDSYIYKSFKIRNELEEIALNQPDLNLRNNLFSLKERLGNELDKITTELKKIIKANQQIKSVVRNFNFSLVNKAYANNNSAENRSVKSAVLYWALGGITLILIFSFYVLVNSKNKKLVDFSHDVIKIILGGFIGIVTGKVT